MTMLRAVRAGTVAPEPEVGAAADVLAALRTRGACFRPELAPLTGRLPAEVDEGLWDLVARGLVTADAFSAVRSLLSARDRWRTRTVRRPSGRLARRRAPVGTGIGEGRWSLLPGPEVLGVARGRRRRARCRATRSWPRRWPSSCWCAGAWWPGSCGAASRSRCPGARWCGRCAGSRRVASRSAAASSPGSRASSTRCPRPSTTLQAVHRRGADGEQVVVAGADPLNMTGSILGGARVPTRRNQRVVYRDGVVVDHLEAG